METTIAVPNSLPRGAAQLKGSAIGALICGVFGSGWMFQALYYGAIATPVWLTAFALFAATFVVWPAAKLFSVRHHAYSSDGRKWADFSKAYWAIVAVEWLGCTVGVNWLSHAGHEDLIPQFIGLIVGLHFLPLAKIFRASVYNWTGAVMLLGEFASLAVPAGNHRDLAAYGAGGLALWATAVVILCKDRFSPR